MGFVKIKRTTFRHFSLACGVAGVLVACLLLWHGVVAVGFLAAWLGFSLVAAAETDVDVTAELDVRTLGRLLRGRSYISTPGKLCDITSYFCLAAAFISWLVLR